MPVVICPACQRKARISDSAIGKNVKCPSCAATFPAVALDAPVTSSRNAAESDSTVEPSPVSAIELSPEEDARRTIRNGVGILTMSQALIALALGLHLIVTLVRLITSDAGSKKSFVESIDQLVEIVATLALLAGMFVAIVGSICCLVPSGAPGPRGLAASVALLSVLTATQLPTGRFRDVVSAINEIGRGALGGDFGPTIGSVMLVVFLLPTVFESGRQALLNLYARSQARRVGDGMTAGLAGLLALAIPIVVIGLNFLLLVVATFASKPPTTFNKVIAVVELLARTALVALGAFVMSRVWMRLGKSVERPD